MSKALILWIARVVCASLALSLIPPSPALAIEWPLTQTFIDEALETAQKVRSAREFDNAWKYKWPCANYLNASHLYIDTPLLQVIKFAYDARMRFDDPSGARGFAAYLNANPTIIFRVFVASSILEDNVDPVVVVEQKDKILKASPSSSTSPDPESDGYYRTVTGKFSLRSFDFGSPFDVIVSHIDDRGREQLIYHVQPDQFN